MSYQNFNFPDYPCKEDMWDKLSAERRPIVVYGMGNGADKLFSRLEKYGIKVSDIFASDGFVRGHSFRGFRVKSFSEIKSEYPEFVILVSFASNRGEVIDMISEISSEYTLYIPDMPVAGDEYFDREFFNSNYEKIKAVYEMLADKKSKMAYSAILNFKLSGKMEYLDGCYSEKSDIYSLISERVCVESYFDAGAYNGDTFSEALRFFSHLKAAVLVEADKRNFKKLSAFASTVSGVDTSLYLAALWRESGVGAFSSSGNRNSSVSSTVSYEHKSEETELLSADSVSKEKTDYIKYDVEGAELEALIGSKKTIDRCRPALLVSLYHRSEDIFKLPIYISENFCEYDLFLRRLRCFPAWEIDLIALPKRSPCN